MGENNTLLQTTFEHRGVGRGGTSPNIVLHSFSKWSSILMLGSWSGGIATGTPQNGPNKQGQNFSPTEQYPCHAWKNNEKRTIRRDSIMHELFILRTFVVFSLVMRLTV